MKAQDMWIWVGKHMLCHKRKFQQGKPVNGGVYVVESWDEASVTVRLHEDYRQRFEENPVEDAENVEDFEEEVSDSDGEFEECKAPPAKKAKKAVDPEKIGVHKLSYADVALMLRPQHALVHASLQGRTMRDKHRWTPSPQPSL